MSASTTAAPVVSLLRSCRVCGERRRSAMARHRRAADGLDTVCFRCAREGTRARRAHPASPSRVVGRALGRALDDADDTRALAEILDGSPTVAGGHRLWLGRLSSSGRPELDRRRATGRVVNVRRLVVRLVSGAEPLGPVRRLCSEPRCIAPDHLSWRSS